MHDGQFYGNLMDQWKLHWDQTIETKIQQIGSVVFNFYF